MECCIAGRDGLVDHCAHCRRRAWVWRVAWIGGIVRCPRRRRPLIFGGVADDDALVLVFLVGFHITRGLHGNDRGGLRGLSFFLVGTRLSAFHVVLVGNVLHRYLVHIALTGRLQHIERAIQTGRVEVVHHASRFASLISRHHVYRGAERFLDGIFGQRNGIAHWLSIDEHLELTSGRLACRCRPAR